MKEKNDNRLKESIICFQNPGTFPSKITHSVCLDFLTSKSWGTELAFIRANTRMWVSGRICDRVCKNCVFEEFIAMWGFLESSLKIKIHLSIMYDFVMMKIIYIHCGKQWNIEERGENHAYFHNSEIISSYFAISSTILFIYINFLKNFLII